MIEARNLEAFLTGIGQADVAKKAGDLASELEARKILRITPKIEIPAGIRIEEFTVGTRSKEYFADWFEGKKPGTKKVIVPSYSQDLIDKITLTTEERIARVIFPTGRDLGLTASTPYSEFMAAGLAKGYELSHPELGLYLRVHDANQPLNEWYSLAMEPITDRDGNPRVFEVSHDSDGLWLRARWTTQGALWDPGDRFAFSLPASEPQKA